MTPDHQANLLRVRDLASQAVPTATDFTIVCEFELASGVFNESWLVRAWGLANCEPYVTGYGKTPEAAVAALVREIELSRQVPSVVLP